jgi:RNA polymerase sigma-70 factor (ECF subfamily)
VDTLGSETLELILEIKRGLNVEANFHRLFKLYCAPVQRFFRRKGLSPEDCGDLTQETFLSVYKGLSELRQEEQFESWLFSIALNLRRNWVDKQTAKKRKVILLSLDQETETGELPHFAVNLADQRADALTVAIEKEKLEQFRAALEQLSEKMARCVQLRVIHDLTNQEIADMLGVSVNTVKAHLHQAREKLREKLPPDFEDFDL